MSAFERQTEVICSLRDLPVLTTAVIRRWCARVAYRDVMERRVGKPFHYGLMFANLITSPHFSVSSAMSLPNSAGEPGSAVLPRSASRASRRHVKLARICLGIGDEFGNCLGRKRRTMQPVRLADAPS